jgi:hypothetical protein
VSITDKLKGAFSQNAMLPEEQQVPGYVQDRMTRAEERMQPLLPQLNERYEFWRGNQYAYVDSKGKLQFMPTKTDPQGRGKRPWKAMGVTNLLMDIVAHEVSASTQRIPSYEVTPTSSDPERRSAAKTSEQVSLWGYKQWGVRRAAVDVVTHAIVGQEGFGWPYYDTSVGPMMGTVDGKVQGRGEVKVQTYGPQDVSWEPGVRFHDSPYHIVTRDMGLMEAVNLEGYNGANIMSDPANQRFTYGVNKPRNTQLVRVRHYLEQPSKSFPTGRWLVIANGRQITAERPYPVPEGICLYPLSYIQDPDNDRDMGLVQHLLDPQRTFNDAWNKIIEWKNMALSPQLFVAPGVLQGQVITNEPGVTYEIADPQNNLQWRDVPALPQELFQIAQDMNSVIARLAAQNDIPSQVEAGKAIQALIERDMNRRQAFISALAEWHGQIASANLRLVQEYYEEPRLLQIKGRWSTQTIKDFKGANLLNQIDVTVAPGSIEPRTKAGMEQKVLAYADRGWITAEQAMSAIEGGYAADIVTSYDLDIGRATRIIARIKEGPEALYGTLEAPAPSRVEIDPNTGEQAEVPDFMPREFDNIAVQKSVFEDWMKTEEYESLTPDLQQAAMEVYQGMLRIEFNKQAQAQMAQTAAAEQAGTMNAAKSMPDAPSPTPGQADEQSLPTPNQPADQSRPTA